MGAMEIPDIYLDAVLAEITLRCHQCQASLDSEDLPEGQPRFGDDNWLECLAAEAVRSGWLIEYTGPDASFFDYRILCPKCSKSVPSSG